LPSEQVLNAFSHVVQPWMDKSQSNEQIVLSNLRDTLLPKLISGELRLNDDGTLASGNTDC
ncbi:MAG: restriction endonuclease subunit S, partial [Plesiomonas sp.]